MNIFLAASALPAHSADIPTLNSYGSLSHADDIEVIPSTSFIEPTTMNNNDSDSAIPHRYKPARTPWLKPHQSETVFALCLFTFGLGLLIYVIVSYWFTHSQISPVIIFICGLLCFIPGCYYLIDHYCFIFKSQRNRHRHLQTIDQDDII